MMKTALYVAISMLATADAAGSTKPATKKDVLGCQPERLYFPAYDDGACKKMAESKKYPTLTT